MSAPDDVPALAAERTEGVRREGDRELPLGAKARQTRNRLLQAAYEQFIETGYRGTKANDICERAGVSLGTFYQYFKGRADVMSALISVAVGLTVEQPGWRIEQGRDGIEGLLRHYVEGYESSAAFQGVWEEATHVDAVPTSVRRDLGRYLTETVERQLRRGQRSGLVRRDVDAATAARALTAMVERYCYLTYVFDPATPPVSVDTSVETLTELWATSLDIR